MEDKMLFIDREIRKLHAFCMQSGYSDVQVESFGDCFKESSSLAQLQSWKRKGLCFILLTLALFLLHRVDPACRLASATARSGVIKLLPLWDWTELYKSPCLIANPLYTTANTLRAEDCQICESVQKIMRVRSVNPADVVEQYLKLDVPVIIEDGLRDWDEQFFLTIRDLAQIFEDDKVLMSHGGCGFSSNLRMKFRSHRDLLHRILRENITSFYAHWENCRLPAAKAFRSFYRRPYFLQTSVETSHTNWIFISSDYTGVILKEVLIDHPVVLLLQVEGQMKVQLLPKTPCEHICEALNGIIHAGEVLVATDFLWKTSYLPVVDEENVAIGIGGSFD